MSPQKTILIIDDEISILESLTSFFEDEGYIVLPAVDGDSGLELFFKESVDLVLTDLRMPGIDGLDVMKAIHQNSPDTPMIVVSGAGKKQDIITALRMGAKDYITKPIEDLNIISHTVAQVLENKQLRSENRAYRKKLKKSENQYRTITENIAEGVFTVDQDENFTYANQAFSNMVGHANKDVLKKNLRDVSSRESFKIILEQTQNRKEGSTDRYVIEMINSEGTTLHVELACSPIFNPRTDYQGAIAVVRDVTQIMELRKTYEKFISQEASSSKDVTPICASCKNIRVSKGEWIPVEEFFDKTVFSHGICPTCCTKLYPDFDFSEQDKPKDK